MGPTTLCFTEGAEGSPPVLVDVRAGFFGREHFLSLFLEEHAPPDAHFLAFQAPVPPELDLWTLWLRLGEAGLCLSPSGGQRTGLFPLVYERGASSLLVAGETQKRCPNCGGWARSLLSVSRG